MLFRSRMIEIQVGAYFGEDDIERLADDYGRADAALTGGETRSARKA